MVYDLVQFGALALVVVCGCLVGGSYLHGGDPWKLVVHAHDVGSHMILQRSADLVSQFQREPKGPRVRTLRPPSTHSIPTIQQTK